MSNSSLVSYVRLSPNRNAPRNNKILKITPHHVVGNTTLEQLGTIMANPARQMSSNYGIDSAGNIGMYCEEKNRSWCSSSPSNDHQAITIEIANDGGPPDYHVSDRALDALIRLSVDICQRNGISKVVYTGNTSGNLTRHNMFAATLCPGPYLQSKLPYVEATVNAKLGKGEEIMSMSTQPVRMWFGPMSSGDRNKFVNMLNEKSIAFTESEGKLITTPAVSVGDQKGLMKLAIETGNIGYGPYCDAKTTGITEEQYNTVLKDLNAAKTELSSTKNKLTTAENNVSTLTKKVSDGLTKANATVTALK